MEASEAQSQTLNRMLARHGEEVTLWRRGKGLDTAARDGAQSPRPRHPLRLTVLYSDRSGSQKGGSAVVYVDADAVQEHGLTAPVEEWEVQRTGETERMPVGPFRPVGSGPDASWWSGIVQSGGSDDAKG